MSYLDFLFWGGGCPGQMTGGRHTSRENVVSRENVLCFMSWQSVCSSTCSLPQGKKRGL